MIFSSGGTGEPSPYFQIQFTHAFTQPDFSQLYVGSSLYNEGQRVGQNQGKKSVKESRCTGNGAAEWCIELGARV
jgi:hypothetical protein